MRILVVGGTGFIGYEVVKLLVNLDHEIVVFHRGLTRKSLPLNVVEVCADQESFEVSGYSSDLLANDYDVVIHGILWGERDSRTAVAALAGRTRRIVVLSSGDVYRAYGIFKRLEEGTPQALPLREDDDLRTSLFPYRTKDTAPGTLLHDYDKILVERSITGSTEWESVVLRLPKVYGSGEHSIVNTTAPFRAWPNWRWTHGFVENVAWGVALAAIHPRATGVYNLGEATTPNIAERMTQIGNVGEAVDPGLATDFNFEQSLVFSTERIRNDLGYEEPVGYLESLKRSKPEASAP